MVRKATKNVIMKADLSPSMKIFGVIVGVIAYAALHLTLVTALSVSVSYWLSALTGAAAAAVFLAFGDRKWVKLGVLAVSALYTVLCIGAGFNAFLGGAGGFWNNLVAKSNANMHYGIAYSDLTSTAGGDFLFTSVLSVWLGLATVAICSVKSRFFVLIAAVLIALWLCLGLYPLPAVAAVLSLSALGTVLIERRFTLKSALCYLACAALILSALAPAFVYNGSRAVRDFRKSISEGIDRILYGSDSLPEGKLRSSSGMRAPTDAKLRVSLTANTPVLYLKGFVGAEFDGDEWSATDKNAYVSDGHQGLLDYVAEEQIPTAQFARYAALNGNSRRYEVSVTNVSANRKYVYAPYSIISYSTGSPYYDLNIRAGLFTSSDYSFQVFSGDRSSERVMQAQWLLNESSANLQQRQYLEYEREYRGFVGDVYTALDPETEDAINAAFNFSGDSINTATQMIRAYFKSKFSYSDTPDKIGGNFIDDFYGGSIRYANSSYFATAATLIFRHYGFAARYAEGYLVRYTGSEDVTDLEVTGNNAHAWTEVYFDGMGWLPIEVTPTYFSEEEIDTPIDPTDPDKPDEPVDPIIPPEKTEEPAPPEPPVVHPTEPISPEEANVIDTLKIVLPIMGAALAVVLAVLIILLRRTVILSIKNKRLERSGADFGRSAFTIISRDCKHFGGFTKENLEKYGVAQSACERFIELVQKSVYSGGDISANERLYVTHFIKEVAQALEKSGGKARAFICKYFFCIGL